MSKLNTLYAQHSAVLKLEGPSKGLMIRPWFNSINALATSLLKDVYPVDGAMRILPHVNNDVYLLYINNQAFEPMPVQPVLPDDADALQFNIFKMRKEEYSKVMTAVDLIHKEIIASLDEEIYSNLTNLGGLRGIYHHSPADIALPSATYTTHTHINISGAYTLSFYNLKTKYIFLFLHFILYIFSYYFYYRLTLHFCLQHELLFVLLFKYYLVT